MQKSASKSLGARVNSFVVAYVPPFLRSSRFYDEMAEMPSDVPSGFPLPTFAFAEKSKDGSTMPQAIAHRGYKAQYPENTMDAFRAAVEVKANALETDIHLTRDGVVVLSHDATLKRCFGKDDRIIDCDWEHVSTMRTLRAPHQRMPRLRDLLEYLATPGLEHVWLMLDIKLDNDAETVMRLIGETIASVAPSPSRAWNERIVLGIWAFKYLPLCTLRLPTFPVAHIGFSTSYARRFFPFSNVSFSMLQQALLVWPFGARFVARAHRCGRPVLAWTVNKDEMMRWCIGQGLDAVITDDPKRFLEVKDEWTAGRRDFAVDPRTWPMLAWISMLAFLVRVILAWKGRDGRRKGRR